MKKYILVLCSAWLISNSLAMAEVFEPALELAQVNEDTEREAPVKDEQKAPAAPANSLVNTKEAEARTTREEVKKALDAQRASGGYSTEYTLDPGSVELVVQLDANNYGFRGRNHSMTLGLDADFLLRGRGMLSYDLRFTEYWSMAIKAGIDWNSISLYGRLREQINSPAPRQFSVLAGLTAKWRLTEWYMRSAVFLEPSFLCGYMWQDFDGHESRHFRLRPGLFAGMETIFDSGLNLSFRVGFEMPFDFASVNPVKEVAEPLALFGIGLAI